MPRFTALSSPLAGRRWRRVAMAAGWLGALTALLAFRSSASAWRCCKQPYLPLRATF